jgi:hypothetical protein
MIAGVVLAIFFSGVFEISAVCLRYISSSKENISAIECVQDRLEYLRNLEFTSLTNATFLAAVPPVPAASPSPTPPQRRNLTVPPNASELATHGTEQVTVSKYPGLSPSVTFTRTPGARINTTAPFSDVNITPTQTWTGGSSFSSDTRLVKVDVKYTWTATFGGRPRTESSSTIISAGTKK